MWQAYDGVQVWPRPEPEVPYVGVPFVIGGRTEKHNARREESNSRPPAANASKTQQIHLFLSSGIGCIYFVGTFSVLMLLTKCQPFFFEKYLHVYNLGSMTSLKNILPTFIIILRYRISTKCCEKILLFVACAKKIISVPNKNICLE
jgi:hypothetical protein